MRKVHIRRKNLENKQLKNIKKRIGQRLLRLCLNKKFSKKNEIKIKKENDRRGEFLLVAKLMRAWPLVLVWRDE